jgi:ribonucleotide monophosphatase NagD (HAD superfamily)
MIGDRLDTDIAGAKALGLPTVLLLTGVTTPEILASSDVWADVAYEDLPALLRAWAGDAWWQARVKARRAQG